MKPTGSGSGAGAKAAVGAKAEAKVGQKWCGGGAAAGRGWGGGGANGRFLGMATLRKCSRTKTATEKTLRGAKVKQNSILIKIIISEFFFAIINN